MTSHDVVEKIRKLAREKRVGHGGTLDPFAQGVLVVGIGRESTKKLHHLLKDTDKEYIATLKLGEVSSTGDPEGEIKITADEKTISALTEEKIKKVLKDFTGEIEQVPPVYSALKVKGVPAYKLARQGKTISLPRRKVIIKELELLEWNPPLAKTRAVVSSGTYIRTLAEDIGRALGVGAYLLELTRMRVGDFRIEESKTLEELETLLRPPTGGLRKGKEEY